MLGIYVQRTWVILNATAFASVPLFIFATPVLKFLGQTASVSREAGKFSLWMIPEHFAYAMTFPSAKFLQAQSKVIVLAVIAAVALCLHAFLSWLLIIVLGWELVGAALALDASWWFIAIAQISFIIAGTFGKTAFAPPFTLPPLNDNIIYFCNLQHGIMVCVRSHSVCWTLRRCRNFN